MNKKVISILIIFVAIVIVIIINLNPKTKSTSELEYEVESFLFTLYDNKSSLVTDCDEPTEGDYLAILTGTEEYLVTPSSYYLPSVIPYEYLKDIYNQYCLNDNAGVLYAYAYFIETVDYVHWFKFEVTFFYEKTKVVDINGIIGTTISGKIISFYSEQIQVARNLDKEIEYDHRSYYN